jgi:hypothetical protein
MLTQDNERLEVYLQNISIVQVQTQIKVFENAHIIFHVVSIISNFTSHDM